MALFGSTYFRLLPSFDYRAHLKSLSQTPRQKGRSLKEEVRGQTELLSDIRNAVGEIVRGISDVNLKLERIENAIETTNSILEWGFDSVLLETARLSRSVTELIAIARTPAHTWALEQFNMALRAHKAALYPEAYERVCRAIDGDKHNSGYNLEHRFYMLRGLIELGSADDPDGLHVNPLQAALSFSSAARYAKLVDVSEEANALCHAGWAFYCTGDEASALENFLSAIKLVPSHPLAHYNAARLLIFRGDGGKGRSHLVRAFENNVLFSATAEGDRPLADYQDILNDAKTEVCTKIAEKYTNRISNMNSILASDDILYNNVKFYIGKYPKINFERNSPLIKIFYTEQEYHDTLYIYVRNNIESINRDLDNQSHAINLNILKNNFPSEFNRHPIKLSFLFSISMVIWPLFWDGVFWKRLFIILFGFCSLVYFIAIIVEMQRKSQIRKWEHEIEVLAERRSKLTTLLKTWEANFRPRRHAAERRYAI